MKSILTPSEDGMNQPLSIYTNRKESERFYTEVFNIVATSIPCAGEPVSVRNFSDIGPAITVYEHRFTELLKDPKATPQQIYAVRTCAAVLKKLELPIFERESREQALKLWYESEAACKDTNRALVGYLTGSPVQAELNEIIVGIRKEVASLLGPNPPDLPDVIGNARFGPGSSSSCPRKFKDACFQAANLSAFPGMAKFEVPWLLKNTMLAEYSYSAYYGVEQVSGTPQEVIFRDALSRVEYVDHERYEDVPKSIDKRRSIGVGPNLATFVAQAYDHDLRMRLRNWGLDLTKQEPNQRLARLGSLGTLDSCTLDLSCATDRVSLGLVHAVLPPVWFRVLYPLRAVSCLMPDGSQVKLEKFSSMGNSLTFSLITLILSALIRSILRERGLSGVEWRVYGDDVIIPKAIYDDVVAAIDAIGLKVNVTKSFSEGSFRESCGCDYHQGVDVRPFYFKKPLRVVTDVYKYINLVAIADEKAPFGIPLFSRLRSLLIGLIPTELRFYGSPSRYLDRYIWVTFTGWGPPTKMVVPVYPIKGSFSTKQAYLLRLYSGIRVESYVHEDVKTGAKSSRLYPGPHRKLLSTDSVNSLRRGPGRKAWLMVATATAMEARKGSKKPFSFF